MSLRVRAPIPAGDVRRSGGATFIEDAYLSRLVKLVPAEAIGPFPLLLEAANNITPSGASERWAVYFVAWILLVIVVVVRWRSTMDPGGPHRPPRGAQWGAVMISAVAFFIWVHVMNGDFGFELLSEYMTTDNPPALGAERIFRSPDGAVPAPASPGAEGYNLGELKHVLSSVALMAWTALAPVVYRGDEEPRAA